MLTLVHSNPERQSSTVHPKFIKRKLFEIEDEARYLVTYPDDADDSAY